MSATADKLPFRRVARVAGAGGVGLTIVLLALAFVWPHQVLRAYLFAFVFWLNVSLGAMGWLMLSHVTGGAWGQTTRRINEAAAGVLPVLALLGLPLLIGSPHLYDWANPEAWQGDPVLMHRRPWFSIPWVGGRAVVAFAAWVGLWAMLRRLSLAQQAAAPQQQLEIGRRMRAVGAVGVVVLFATVSLLSVDWIMSLEPHWISSIFGLIILMGQATSALAMVVLVLWLIERKTARLVAPPDRVHDLGKMLLTAVVLWAYMSFSQYLIQWIGHTQEDIRWYVQRLQGGWSWAGMALCVFGLGVPLLLLLSRPLKRSLTSLAVVAAWVFGTRVLDVLWTIAPSGREGQVGGVYWTDPLAWIGLGGIWIAAFLWHLGRAPIDVPGYLTSGANVTGMVNKGAAHAG